MVKKYKNIRVDEYTHRKLFYIAKCLGLSAHETILEFLNPAYELLASFKSNGQVVVTSETSILNSNIRFDFTGKSKLIAGKGRVSKALESEFLEKEMEKIE